MTPTRYAFIKANWHSEIVDHALVGFRQVIAPDQVDVIDVPGAFELPLMARELARSARYDAIAAAALVVDGGIYRHDFVAQAVVTGLMQAGLDTGVPVLSVSLTPHHFQETQHHIAIYRDHFVLKGREAAEAALMITRTRRDCGIDGPIISGRTADRDGNPSPLAGDTRLGGRDHSIEWS